ncbi:relaxase/mobilization nuclease domain-containing protein [Saccharicrinis aurantiacus]|uniref:relaxase/mobilization nuclease domain-containing protein n=1 Tax=Saccharicrinis aurantiacus TaxID=1849719 RepID=UPI00094FF63A|nr:relaxase/mobilization nuclease domain-containing protein [Saccharicrinis aurantiacus]
MISKIVMGSDAYGCCKYLLQDEKRATVIDSNGVRNYDYKLMAADFNTNRELLPELNKHVVHAILSFPHEEQPSNLDMVKYGRQYLNELGLDSSPYCFVHHNDKKHSHFHIVSSLVDLQGNKVNDSWIGLRGKKAAQKVTLENNLIPAVGKHVSKMNLSALNEKEAAKYKAYLLINSSIDRCYSFSELGTNLEKKNIKMAFKYKRGDQSVIQGISFHINGYSFKGSEIDRKLSYKSIENRLIDNRHSISPKVQLSTKNYINNHVSVDKNMPIDTMSNVIGSIGSSTGNYIEENENDKKRKKRIRPKF